MISPIVRSFPECHVRLTKTRNGGESTFVYPRIMTDIGFSEQDFWIILLVFGGIGILASGLLFFIQDLRARRNQRAQIQSLLKSVPVTAPLRRPKVSIR